MAGLRSCKRARGHEHGSPLGGGLQLCGFMQTVDSGEWAHQESHTTRGAATSLETRTQITGRGNGSARKSGKSEGE